MRAFRFWMFPVLIALSFAGASAGRASDSGPADTAELELKHLAARDAAVVVRAIAGRPVEIVSDRVIRVTDTAGARELAEQVIALVDSPPGSVPAAFTVPSDGSRVAAFRFQRARSADVMKALRTVLRVSKLAVQEDPPLVIIRDTEETAERARALIEILDQSCP